MSLQIALKRIKKVRETKSDVLDLGYFFLKELPEEVRELFWLKMLCYSNNNLTTLDEQGLTSLQTLDCNSNKITTLNVQGCTSLQILRCYHNKITSLNVQGLTNLQVLWCYSNQITTLNVQGLTNLQGLYCNNNNLTTLDVQGLTNLKRLECYDNQLTSLNVHGLTNLQILTCNGNPIASIAGLNKNTQLYFDTKMHTKTIWYNPQSDASAYYDEETGLVHRGCFIGTMLEFKERVKEKYKGVSPYDAWFQIHGV